MTARRNRARYASDALVERAVALSLKHGVKLKLAADGSVEITGKLDSRGADGAVSSAGGGADAEEAERWFRENSPAGRQ